MSVAQRLLTYDDLRDTPDDGRRYEIIGGEMRVTPAPSWRHQEISIRLASRFHGFVTQNGLGRIVTAPIDVKLSEHDTVQPDLVFLSNERRHLLRGGAVHGAPDLVVELLSPTTRADDEGRKAELYAGAGVREYWQLDPEYQDVRVYVLHEGRFELVPQEPGTVRSVILPGLVIDLATLFADLW